MAGLDGRKISPHRDSIPGSSGLQSVAIPTELPGPHNDLTLILPRSRTGTQQDNDIIRTVILLQFSAICKEVSRLLLTPTSPQFAFILRDIENHRRHRDISMETEMVFCNSCFSAIQVTTVTVLLELCNHFNILCFNLQVPCVLYIGQAFHYSPENAFYIFNQQIYFII